MFRSWVLILLVTWANCQMPTLELSTMAPSSKRPSLHPSIYPSFHPSIHPSFYPSFHPSHFPTFTPSSLPSRRPSSPRPSHRPSRSPSHRPSRKPTKKPTSRPTARPTARPSPRPSSKPTARPSTRPTKKPTSKPTKKPSAHPSAKPTKRPTAVPSSKPSAPLAQFIIHSIIQFDKCNSLDAIAQSIWHNVTAITIRSVLATLLNDATSIEVSITILGQGPRRRLQLTSPLYISFDIHIRFRSTSAYNAYTLEDYVLSAFNTTEKKTNYIFSLQEKSSTFSSINKMIITIQDMNTPQPTLRPMLAPAPPKDRSAIIITASAVGGILSLFACACIFRRRRKRSNRRQPSAFSQRSAVTPHEPTLIQVLPTDEDVSTLSDGQVVTGGINIFGIVDGNDHTDGSSMISSDYDYNMLYGGAGDIQSISTAGGMKSVMVPKPLLYPKMTQEPYNISRQSSISSKQSDPSAVSMKESLTLSDDNSFERQYGEPEERIEIFAPAGKLGIVIDTPNGGVPMVHAIKESSVLIDRVKVGDKLVMVDGIDTTTMSAIKVSRLISTRSDNPRRVLIFLRYHMDE